MSSAHQWRLVAPWYRWQRQIEDDKVASSPRDTRPSLQKFDEPGFVDGFIADPQRSLKFSESLDRVQNILSSAAGASCRKLGTFNLPGQAKESIALCPSGERKIYLDTHRRYYLVVCELHCDRPYFPRVRHDEVARAGFVVRRRWRNIPSALEGAAKKKLEGIVELERKLSDIDETRWLRPGAARRRSRRNQRLEQEGRLSTMRASIVAELAQQRAELQAWSADSGIAEIHEGWFPTDMPNIGAWRLAAETPEQVDEVAFPLYPLRPDPADTSHDAAQQTLFFGVLPTSSLDTDRYGGPRFDANHRYEIRCFVQRHAPECPPPARPELAHGEVVWSEPTEPYRLARATDPLGCANRVTNIELPDFREMIGLAAAMPAGKLASTRFDQPQGLMPAVDDAGALNKGASGVKIGQICFFAFPLITIVATFVLKLFLPIVVFVFGLWFLLAFKFCIPPSLGIGGGLDVDLQVDLEFQLSASLDFEVDVDLGLITDAKAQLTDMIRVEEGMGDFQANMLDGESNVVIAEMFVHSANPDDAVGRARPDAPAPFGPDLQAERDYEDRWDVKWRFG